MTIILNQCLSHPSLHPKNLGIIPRRKSWLLNLDAMVLSDSGNVYDALFLAARSALWDTKVPKTRSVQYQPKSNVASDQDVEMSADGSGSIFNTREVTKAADFELADYWDEGGPLEINQEWPVCVTLNLVRTTIPVGVGAHYGTGVSKTTTGILPRRNTPRGSIDPASIALAVFIFPIGNEATVYEDDGGWRGPARIDDSVTRGEPILSRGPYLHHPDSFLTCHPPRPARITRGSCSKRWKVSSARRISVGTKRRWQSLTFGRHCASSEMENVQKVVWHPLYQLSDLRQYTRNVFTTFDRG